MQEVGKYQLVRKLATGGMAEVFLAKASGPMGFEKTLVLKRILPHLAEEPTFVEMFLSEAKLAARLTHSHIAQIFDFGEADGAHFLAMEYIDGPSLRTVIKRATAQGLQIPPAICARIVAHACEGLAFAHDFTDPETEEPLLLIHRDISPENILLSRQGEVKVVDFGIAKAAGQNHRTETGALKGKLAYMAPEQIRGREKLDRRADVYALGVVFYELLAGRKPNEADTDLSLMDLILNPDAAPVPVTQLRPELPEAVQYMLEQAMAKDREQRYPDCHAFQADLEEFIVSLGRPVTTPYVAQFIAHITLGAELPQPTPHAGTPRSRPGFTPISSPGPLRSRSAASSPGVTAAPSPSRPGVTAAPSPSHSGVTAAPSPSHSGVTSPVTATATVTAAPPVTAAPIAPDEEPTPVSLPSAEAVAPHTVLPGRAPPGLALALGGVLLALGAGAAWFFQRTPAEPPATVAALPAPAEPVAPPSSPPPPTPAVTPEPPPVAVAAPEPSPTPVAVASSENPSATPPEATPPPESAPAEGETPARGKRPTAPARVARGTLVMRVWPYATVFVDGKPLGSTPLAPRKLAAGHYTVTLVNEQLAKRVTRDIEVKPDESTILKVNLTEE